MPWSKCGDQSKLPAMYVQANPALPEANYGLGLLARQIGNPEAGLHFLKLALAAAPAEDAATMMIPVTVAGAAPGPGAAAGARLRPSSRRISGPTHSVIILRDS